MMQKTNWYVITGGPCAGKSQTLNYMAFLGYSIVPSLSRIQINVELSKGKTIEEIRSDEAEFQRIVFNKRRSLEDSTPPESLRFFERGMPDCIAYYQHCNQDPYQVIEACKDRKYRKVFLLDQLPYEEDYARVEDEKDARELHELIGKAYSDLGYKVIEVPVKPIDERASLIMNEIEKLS